MTTKVELNASQIMILGYLTAHTLRGYMDNPPAGMSESAYQTLGDTMADICDLLAVALDTIVSPASNSIN